MEHLQIHVLPSYEQINEEKTEYISALVNRVYEIAEKGLWKQGMYRTTAREIADLINKEELIVAEKNNTVIGCVHMQKLDDETAVLGMLAVDDRYQKNGIGRQIMTYAEELCRKANIKKLKLELLVPTQGTHPTKVFLDQWYRRLGFEVIHVETVAEVFPRLIEMLQVPCQFLIFEKRL